MQDGLWQDVRYAGRTLTRAPGLSLLVILTLAVVISVTTSLFSVANTLLLRPAAGRHPEQLVRVYMNRGSNVHFAEYADLREAARTVELAAFVDQRVSVGDGADAETAFAELLTGNYGQVVGVAPALGRMLQPDDEQAGAMPVVVLSDHYWRRRFAADPRALGQSIAINGATFTVVGVMPASFHGAFELLTADLWVPFALDPLLRPGTTALVDRAPRRGVQVIGRLREGTSIEAAGTELRTIGDAMAARHPGTPPDRRPSVYRAWFLPPEARAPITLFLSVLLAIAGVLLAAACANVANVLLARGAARAREVAVRQAIGATRWRLIRQQLAEGLVLSAAAMAAGLLLTMWFTEFISTVRPPVALPVALDVVFDWRVVLFACGVAMTATVLCSLAPALQGTRGPLLPSLRAGNSTGAQRSRMRSAFVVAQVASSVLLLIVAGLLLRGLGRAASLDLGLDTRQVLLVAFDTQTRGYSEERALTFYDALLERVESIPGVEAATLSAVVPLSLENSRMGMMPRAADPPVEVTFNSVSRGTFSTLGMRLLDGRDFDARDTTAAPAVAIVNEALARHWFGSGAAVGRRFVMPGFPGEPATEPEIVGVASNAAYTRIGEPQTFYAYFPIAQRFSPAPTLMVRTTGAPESVVPAVRSAIRAIDVGLPVVSTQTLESSSSISVLPARVAASVSGVLGALVLVLSTVGLYGVIGFMVRQRRREIGIRMSLGATGGRVAGLFLRQSARWAGIGMGIGVVIALGAGKIISSLLFGVSPVDPATFAGVIGLMLAVTLAAAYIPARRAASLDPVEALRVD